MFCHLKNQIKWNTKTTSFVYYRKHLHFQTWEQLLHNLIKITHQNITQINFISYGEQLCSLGGVESIQHVIS